MRLNEGMYAGSGKNLKRKVIVPAVLSLISAMTAAACGGKVSETDTGAAGDAGSAGTDGGTVDGGNAGAGGEGGSLPEAGADANDTGTDSDATPDPDSGTDGGNTDAGDSGFPHKSKLIVEIAPNPNNFKEIVLPGDLDVNGGCYSFINPSDIDIVMSTLTLHHNGSVDSIDTLALYAGSTKVSDIENINKADNTAVFNNLNFKIPRSANKTLCVSENINSAAPCIDTTDFIVESAGDVVAIDTIYGLPADVEAGITFPIPTGGVFVDCPQKDFTVTYNGPGSGTLQLGQIGAPCMDLTLENKSTEDFYIQDWPVEILASKATAGGGLLDTTVTPAIQNYTLFKLDDFAAGGIIMGPGEYSNDPAGDNDYDQTVILDGITTIPAGQKINTQILFNIRANSAMVSDSVSCILQWPIQVFHMDGTKVDPAKVSPIFEIWGKPQEIVP